MAVSRQLTLCGETLNTGHGRKFNIAWDLMSNEQRTNVSINAETLTM